MKKSTIAIVALGAVLVVAGLTRLRLDADVFNLLPSDSGMVEGLELYHQSFGSNRELILSVRAHDAETAERTAGELAEALEAAELSPRVVWRSPLTSDPAELAELLAYAWFNQRPEVFEAMARRFEEGELEATLAETLERMAISFNPEEVARLARDPYGLTSLVDELAGAAPRAASDPFASPSGTFRVLFAAPPFEEGGFWKIREWVAEVRHFVEVWPGAAGEGLSVRVTGNPAMVAETGSGLLRDIRASALGTLVFVAFLFWWAHRRWAPLLWLVVLLLVVVASTAAVGGALLGTLNAVSLGFAAILLGLAADYGLILYQEFIAHPDRSVAEHRVILAPSILWAAVTTAGAFFLVGRSSLPGLNQLGILVAVGVLIAACLKLLAFLPPLARWAPAAPGPRADAASGEGERPTSGGLAWGVSLLAVIASVGVLLGGFPGVDYGTEQLGPRESRSRSAIEEVDREIGSLGDSLWLLVGGADEGQVGSRLASVGRVLEASVRSGLLESYALPDSLWPRPAAQAANRRGARWLAERWEAARSSALEAGFNNESLRLTAAVFAAWERFAAGSGVSRPESDGASWVFRQFTAAGDGQLLALGRLEPAEGARNGELLELASELRGAADGTRLFSWGLLSESLLGVMERDVRRVLVPMGIALLVLLTLAFRRVKEVVLSVATLVFSLLCLFGVMALLGWSWNLMNVMALPLLFGAGVDYSIHIQLALRRYDGDVRRVRWAVGRAILLCGASTASGFGTLALASNAGLASLGRVCAVGIAIAASSAVFLLPAWWRTLVGRGQGSASPEVTT